tara:strand:+ start:1637 stop:1888 length:252 start_codon:yes stop_codon:yes gene_type:complete
MSLKKENKILSIEVSGEFKTICVKMLVTVKENNTSLSSSNWRECYDCLTPLDTLEPEVKEIAEAIWTDEIKLAYNNHMNEFAT